jgi:hypothetical protein
VAKLIGLAYPCPGQRKSPSEATRCLVVTSVALLCFFILFNKMRIHTHSALALVTYGKLDEPLRITKHKQAGMFCSPTFATMHT